MTSTGSDKANTDTKLNEQREEAARVKAEKKKNIMLSKRYQRIKTYTRTACDNTIASAIFDREPYLYSACISIVKAEYT